MSKPALRLVETPACSCGSKEFAPFGKGFYCKGCQKYTPPEIKVESAHKSLKDNLQQLTALHARLKFMLSELEDLVKN